MINDPEVVLIHSNILYLLRIFFQTSESDQGTYEISPSLYKKRRINCQMLFCRFINVFLCICITCFAQRINEGGKKRLTLRSNDGTSWKNVCSLKFSKVKILFHPLRDGRKMARVLMSKCSMRFYLNPESC